MHIEVWYPLESILNEGEAERCGLFSLEESRVREESSCPPLHRRSGREVEADRHKLQQGKFCFNIRENIFINTKWWQTRTEGWKDCGIPILGILKVWEGSELWSNDYSLLATIIFVRNRRFIRWTPQTVFVHCLKLGGMSAVCVWGR